MRYEWEMLSVKEEIRVITVSWYWEIQNKLPNNRELSKIAGGENSVTKSVATIVVCVFLFLCVWQIVLSKRAAPAYDAPPLLLHKEAVIPFTEIWYLFPTLVEKPCG